jgi:hypothetical protein
MNDMGIRVSRGKFIFNIESYKEFNRLNAENAELKSRWERLEKTVDAEIERRSEFIKIPNQERVAFQIMKQYIFTENHKMQELESGGESPRKVVGRPDEGEPAFNKVARGRTPKPDSKKGAGE